MDFIAGNGPGADVAHLIQQADGTIVTAAGVAQQVGIAAAEAGVSAGQAVATGQQMADQTIAAPRQHGGSGRAVGGAGRHRAVGCDHVVVQQLGRHFGGGGVVG